MYLTLEQMKQQAGTVEVGTWVLPLDGPQVPCVVVEVLRDHDQFWSYSVITAEGKGWVLDRNDFVVITEGRAAGLLKASAKEPVKETPKETPKLDPGVNPKPPRRRSPSKRA